MTTKTKTKTKPKSKTKPKPKTRSKAPQAKPAALTTFAFERGATLSYEMEDFDRKDRYRFEVKTLAPELRVAWKSQAGVGTLHIPAKARARATALTTSFDARALLAAGEALPVFLLSTETFAALRDHGRATIGVPDGPDAELAVERIGHVTIEVNGEKRAVAAVFAKPIANDVTLSLAILDDRASPIVLAVKQEEGTHWTLVAASGVELAAVATSTPAVKVTAKPADRAKARPLREPDWAAESAVLDHIAESTPLARAEIVFANKPGSQRLDPYWSHYAVAGGTVFIASKDHIYRVRDGEVAPIAAATFPSSFTAVGDRLQWQQGDKVMRLAIAGGQPQAVAKLPDEAAAVCMHGELMAWFSDHSVAVIRDGKSKKLVRNARNIGGLALTADRAIYLDAQAKAVFAIRTTGGEPQRLAKVKVAGDLAVAGDCVYWCEAETISPSVGWVMRCRLDDGTLDRPVVSSTRIIGFAVDPGHVYLANAVYANRTTTTLIVRYPLDGAPPALVARVDGSWGRLVLGDGWLYASDDGAIARIRLP